MTDIQRKETEAFFSFFATYELARPVTTVSDLSDGAALFEVLSLMCVVVFSILVLPLSTERKPFKNPKQRR